MLIKYIYIYIISDHLHSGGVKKMNHSNSVHATIIDNTTGDEYISMYWKEHFHKTLNSNIVDENLKLSIVSTFNNIQYSEDMTVS